MKKLLILVVAAALIAPSVFGATITVMATNMNANMWRHAPNAFPQRVNEQIRILETNEIPKLVNEVNILQTNGSSMAMTIGTATIGTATISTNATSPAGTFGTVTIGALTVTTNIAGAVTITGTVTAPTVAAGTGTFTTNVTSPAATVSAYSGNSLTLTGNLSAVDGTLSGDLYVADDAGFADDVSVTGALTVAETVTVLDTVTAPTVAAGTATVSTNFTSPLGAITDLTVNSLTLNDGTVTGAVTIAETLGVTGNISGNNYSGNDVTATGNASAVDGTLSGDLYVADDAGFADDVAITGAVTIAETLGVTGNISGNDFSGNIGTFTGAVTAASFVPEISTVGDLNVQTNITIGAAATNASTDVSALYTTSPENPTNAVIWSIMTIGTRICYVPAFPANGQ